MGFASKVNQYFLGLAAGSLSVYAFYSYRPRDGNVVQTIQLTSPPNSENVALYRTFASKQPGFVSSRLITPGAAQFMLLERWTDQKSLLDAKSAFATGNTTSPG